MMFPKELTADESWREGRMLAAGDIRITVTDLESGSHITVRFKSILDNRPGSAHPGTTNHDRMRPDEQKNWLRVPLLEASHVFLEVPNVSGEFPDKIGTYYPRTGRFFADQHADPERIYAAISAAHWIVSNGAYDEDNLTFLAELRCGRCGALLTDPESIERGIGPECFGMITASHHQVKRNQRKERLPETIDMLNTLSTMDDEQVDMIRAELEMWQSQRRA